MKNITGFLTATLIAVVAFSAAQAAAAVRTVTVMTPLFIGELDHPYSDKSAQAWDHFRESLREAKRAGVDAVTSDVWWGLVQAEGPGKFNWGYYHYLANEIRKAGLKWIPILSTHACGGNVGDTVNIPIPKWIWQAGAPDGRSIRFKSEAGNESDEYVSFQDTPRVLSYYSRFYAAFRDEFKNDADLISEIIVGLGPSGEIHYPSYHAHDAKVWYRGYPYRGVLQASSQSAQESFRAAMLAKYGSAAGVSRAWGGRTLTNDEIRTPSSANEAEGLFANPTTPYAQDFFDWYRGSMLEHVKTVGNEAMGVFSQGAFAHTPIGYKIPGVHWSMQNRFAELTSGLLSTRQSERDGEWNRIDQGLGYRQVFKTLDALRAAHPDQPVRFYYTAGMTPNGNSDPRLPPGQSRAEDQAQAMLSLAHQYHLRSGLENALDTDLAKPGYVDLLKRVMRGEGYATVAFLRVDDVLASGVLRDGIRDIHSWPPIKCEARLMYR